MDKHQYLNMVYKSSLMGRTKAVFFCLLDHCNKEGECFPSLKTLASKSGFSLTSVKRAIRELEEAGYIKRGARFDERKNGGQTSNLYTVCLPAPTQSEPFSSCHTNAEAVHTQTTPVSNPETTPHGERIINQIPHFPDEPSSPSAVDSVQRRTGANNLLAMQICQRGEGQILPPVQIWPPGEEWPPVQIWPGGEAKSNPP